MAPKKTLLVVEDDLSVLNILEAVLTRAGYDVVRAKDGEEGGARAEGYPRVPDLILADIMMPGMDGYEMRGMLLTKPATRSIPFIFLTAKTARVDKAKAFALGTYRYLTKPFTSGGVLGEVRQALDDAEERNRLTARWPQKHSGSLKDSSVHSLVDFFIVNRLDGKIKITSGYSSGVLGFKGGEITESDAGQGHTWTALEEMLTWKDGIYELERT